MDAPALAPGQPAALSPSSSHALESALKLVDELAPAPPAARCAVPCPAFMSLSAVEAKQLSVLLAAASNQVTVDTRKNTEVYDTFTPYTKNVSVGAVHIKVNNSEIPAKVGVAPAAKKHKAEDSLDAVKVSCHEASRTLDVAKCVKCTKCARYFGELCVNKKFKSDPGVIRGNPDFECWHCLGVCGLHSCVEKREGGWKAGDIEKRVGKKYYELIVDAKRANYASVQAHLKATGSDKAW